MAGVLPTPKSLPLDGTQGNACPSLRLALALLLSCVSALKKMTIEPDYLVKDYIIRVPMRNCTEERAEKM